MDSVSSAWLDCARACVELVADERVNARWDAPSCLPDMTVSDLAGHASHSGVFMVEEAFAATTLPDGSAWTAAQLLSGVPLDADDPIHEDVRFVAAAQSSDGHRDLVARLHGCVRRVEPLLGQAEDRIVVFPWGGGLPMTKREFLRSRVVELAVHLDDLSESVEIGYPALSPATVTLACEVGVAINVERYGAHEVLRALFRRERGSLDWLRTF